MSQQSRTARRAAGLLAGLVCALLLACAGGADPMRYRLSHSGEGWYGVGEDAVLEDLRSRYPEYFGIVLDARSRESPNLRDLRNDMEREPVTRANYDALNAIAIGYFELNSRAEQERGGPNYLKDSFRAARIVAVPWKAYTEVEDPELRSAILAFFEDITSGEKLDSATTASRLIRVVSSLARREDDPERLARIEAMVEQLRGEAGSGR